MASQPEPHVGLTGARFGRVRRTAPDDVPEDVPQDVPEPSAADRPAPTGARFGRVRREAPEPEDEPFEPDDRPAPTGARFGGASGGRRRKRSARTAARPRTPPSPEAADAPTPDAPAGYPNPGTAAAHWTSAPEPAPDLEPDRDYDPRSAPTVRVRPYVHTGGRTRAHNPLPIEALVYAVPGSSSLGLHGTHRSVLELCRRPQSVAEVSALLGLPLGVARVLVDDLIAERVVTVQRGVDQNAPDITLMRRVLAGLHQL